MARRPLAATALLGLLAPLLLVPIGHALTPPAEPSHPPVWDKAPGGTRYVAMGDSFASGPGIAPERLGPCQRSERNYATLLATAYDVNAFTDASCGGARTVDFQHPQVRDSGTNPAQFDALGDDTTLVTFGTMGGNDIGLVQLATGCVQGDCVPAAGTDPLGEKFAALETSLVDNLAEAQRRAPNAEIVVVGYGTYVLTENCETLASLGVTPAEAAYLQGQIDRLSDLLADVSAAAGVTFADMRDIPGASEHTACAPEADQWIRGLYFGNDGTIFHPSSAGMQATADHLVSVIGEPPVTPEPEPVPPTKKERRDALRKKASKARLAVTCTNHRPANRKVRMRIRNGGGAVHRVVFRVGKKKVGADRRAPYTLQRKAKRIKRHKGKVRAVVTFRDRGVTVKRTIVKKRPRCMR